MKKLLIFLLVLCLPLTCFASTEEDMLADFFDTPSGQSAQFTDLDTVPWAVDAISYLSLRRAVSPAKDGLFSPNRSISRGEFVKILVLALGMYDPDDTLSFDDSKPGDWHFDYISTAARLGIAKGRTDRTFGVNDPITRQEVAALMCRAANVLDIPLPDPKPLTFADKGGIDPWAADAVAQLCAAGVLSGTPDNLFLPLGDTTRAESCKIIHLIATKDLINF